MSAVDRKARFRVERAVEFAGNERGWPVAGEAGIASCRLGELSLVRILVARFAGVRCASGELRFPLRAMQLRPVQLRAMQLRSRALRRCGRAVDAGMALDARLLVVRLDQREASDHASVAAILAAQRRRLDQTRIVRR